MAKKVAKKEAPKKVSPKKVEKKAAKKPEPKKAEKKAVKVDKKPEKKPVKKPEPKKVEKKDLKVQAKKNIPHKPVKKEEKKTPKVEMKKKPEPKLDKKALAKMKEQEKKASAKAKELEKKQKAQEAKDAKEAEKKKKEEEKAAAKEAARLQKEKEQEEKKAAKKAAKGQPEEEPKKPGRPAKEASSDDDLVGADDGDWEEEEIIDIDEVESEKRDFSIDDELKDNLVGDILSRADCDSLKDLFEKMREPKFFTSGVDECIERNCDNPATTSNFCRLHYIKNWNDIKKRQQILADGTLQELIEVLVSKYPVKYIEAILQDLADDKIFHSVLKELNIEAVEESFDDELEDVDDDSDIAFETKTTFKGLGDED